MPSVSSRPCGLLAGLVSLQLGLAFDLGLTPQPARAELRWARGVFPIVHFAGYTSHFGRRTGPGGGREMHSGLDIAAQHHGMVAPPEILEEARNRGYERLSLETGSTAAFRPAQCLYESVGFTCCGPFANYLDDPYSVFMTKKL